MTGRPPRDVRHDAAQRLTALLRREQHPAPEILANELLIALDGAHIGLTDTTPPTDPAADPFTRPTPATPDSDALAQYRAARAALKGHQQ